MQYTTLGRTGLKVSVLGIGGGGPSRLGRGTGKTQSDSIALVQQALDAGINYIDTAEAYDTEGFVGKAIQGIPREKLVISTKKSTWSETPITPTDLRTSLEASLWRLGTGYVDVYSLHAVGIEQYDYMVSEILPVMQQLQAEGKIRFIGITEAFHSDPGHAMLQRALQDDVWDVIMVGFNILNQSARQRVFTETLRRNIGIQIMFAVRLALSKPERLREVIQTLIQNGQLDPQEIDIENPLGFVLAEGGAVSLPDAAYRFCRDEPGTHVILSGTGNPEHLQENIASLARHPLPDGIENKLKFVFRKVDSVSGQ